jgi:hypothetical protein
MMNIAWSADPGPAFDIPVRKFLVEYRIVYYKAGEGILQASRQSSRPACVMKIWL